MTMLKLVFISALSAFWITSNEAYTNTTGPLNAEQGYSPVFLIPGFFGSRLEVKFAKDKGRFVSFLTRMGCRDNTADRKGYYTVWLCLKKAASDIKGLYRSIQRHWNSETHKYADKEGETIDVVGYGDPASVEYVSAVLKLKSLQYYRQLAQLLRRYGYKDEKNLFGLPYDFRLTAFELKKWMNNTKALIEKAVVENNNTPATLVGHSNGNVMADVFLNKRSKAWKNKYIREYIAISPANGGALGLFYALTHGDQLNPLLACLEGGENDRAQADILRSWTVTYQLLPQIEFFNKIRVASIGDKNYTGTLKNLKFLIRHAMDKETSKRWIKGYKNFEKKSKKLRAPGVPINCIYSKDLDTPGHVSYDSMENYPYKAAAPHYMKGDGTVPAAALVGICDRWEKTQSDPVQTKLFSNINHVAILNHRDFLNWFGKTYLSGYVEQPYDGTSLHWFWRILGWKPIGNSVYRDYSTKSEFFQDCKYIKKNDEAFDDDGTYA